jgi:predicted ribosome quality control (RQC) complex YloA/Tae2 family protein
VDEAKTQDQVDNLIDRIQGKKPDANSPTQVPSIAESMSQAFVDFFNRVIDELTRQLNATPAPPADVQNQLKKEIQDLKDKIDLLKKPLA